jgi:DNA-binding MarR family transcriptional regulator
MDRSSTAQVVGNLERRQLIERQRSDSDQRAKIVRLSETGRSLLAAALARVEAAQQRILAPLDARESNQLMTLLTKLAEGNNAVSRAPVKLVDAGA